MDGSQKNDRSFRWLLIAAALSPGLLIASIVWKTGVDVPFWDEWELVPVFKKAFTGTLTWNDLFAQHNEHRIFFPRLIFIGLARIFQWNVCVPMYVNVLCVFLASVALYRVQKRTLDLPPDRHYALWFLTNLMLFTPFQGHAWIWGICLTNTIPLLTLVLCLWTCSSPLSFPSKFAACAALSIFGTFSTGNGMLNWGLAFPLLFSAPTWSDVFKRKGSMVLWISLAACSAALYFHGYWKPAKHPSLLSVVDAPYDAVRYFFAFLGAPLGHGSGIPVLVLTKFVALIIVLMFALCLAYVLWCRQYALFQRVLPWAVLGLYSLLNAAVIAVGRAGFGIPQALSPRYAVFSVALIVAVVQLYVIVSAEIQKKPREQNAFSWSGLSLCLLTVFLMLHVQTSAQSLAEFGTLYARNLRMKAAITLIDIGPSEPLLHMDDRKYSEFREYALTANNLKLFRQPLITDRRISLIAASSAETPINIGAADGIRHNEKGNVIVHGWGLAPDGKRPADMLLLTASVGVGEELIVELIDSRVRRDDIARWSKDSLMCGYVHEILPGKVPDNAMLRVWVYDAISAKAYAVNKELLKLPEKSP
ncbi:MAG TPA: hypothetical protein VEK08_22155 [Planctomycetota bacterium]|nr:hypothetical protein [Planctomycetota bacterium]